MLGWQWGKSWLSSCWGQTSRGEARLLQNAPGAELSVERNFLTLSRVILDSECVGAVNVWEMVLLLCSCSLPGGLPLKGKGTARSKGQVKRRPGGVLASPILELGAERKTVTSQPSLSPSEALGRGVKVPLSIQRDTVAFCRVPSSWWTP